MGNLKIIIVLVVFAVGVFSYFFLARQEQKEIEGATVTELENENQSIKKPGSPDYRNITIKDVIKKDLKRGEGKAVKDNSTVLMNYESWVYMPARLANKGRAIANTKGQPEKIQLGKRKLIVGWEKGVVGMQEGGKRQLIIPSEMAYGEDGVKSQIPPNAIILVEVEIVKVL